MSKEDIRWEQRFSNFNKALDKLDQAVKKIRVDYAVDDDGNVAEDEFLDDIIKEGLIQRFEYTHELAWKVMKDFLEDVGEVKMYGSKDATKEAFAAELIEDGDVWMEMIISRNMTSHTYNEETADEIFNNIMDEYHKAFIEFRDTMEEKRSGTQTDIFKAE